MSHLATPVQRWLRCTAASANFDYSYHIDPERSIIKCYCSKFSHTETYLEHAERCDPDARCRLLADPATAPTPLERPFLQRLSPADDAP